MNKGDTKRAIAFLIVLVLFLNLLCSVFRVCDQVQTGGYTDYKKLPKGSVDAVYIGNSGVSRYWICSQAYDKYGMVVFPLATDGMPSWLIQSMLCEAYKYQTPELVLIDVRAFAQAAVEDYTEASNHYVLDRLPWFSVNRLCSIIRTIKAQIESKSENMPKFGLAYFFPILSYHDKWLDHDVFNTEENEEEQSFLGFYCNTFRSVRKRLTQEEADALEKSVNTVQTDKRVPLNQVSEKSLRKLLRYIDRKKINAVFIGSPTIVDEELIGKYNTISDMLSDYGYQFLVINAANIGDYAFDFKNDFYNQMHTNYLGAKKYTNYLADYLNSEYDFPDHRNDPDTSMFDGVSRKISEFLA